MKRFNFTLYINNFIKTLLVLFLLSLFFPIRHVFLTKEAYLTGVYSDFTSFSLYLSDILIFTTWFLLLLPRGKDFYHVVKKLKWLILAVLLIFIAHFGLNIRLNAYLLIKWLELIVAYGTFALLFRQNGLKTLFLKLFAWLCGLESLIALVQFARQSSIGLYKIGESHLAPNLLGVAKIVSGGTTFIRGYGTFPHPNPLSAFIVAGVLITIYLLTLSTNKKQTTLYSILLFLNILGLTVTFSRGAYLALAAGLIIFFGLFFLVIARRSASDDKAIFSNYKIASSARQSPGLLAMTPIVVLLISIAVSFFLFKPFLLTRATFSDQSTVARKFYDVAGIKMAEKNPIFGVGLGESSLQMEKYLPATNFFRQSSDILNKPKPSESQQTTNSNQKLEAGEGKPLAAWDKQPPHNYFIIVAAEMGIPAMLILLWIFLFHLYKLFKQRLTAYNLLLITVLVTFLLLMQFDHCFYTLQQTQLLLWIFLALALSAIQSPSPRNGEG